MSLIAGKRLVGLSIFCLLSAFSQAVFAQDKEWRVVTPAELTMKTPKVEADADAEAIFWETRIDDSSDEKLSRRNYVRVKIFTERGREKFSKVDIPFLKGLKIKEVAARVIKTDGSIVELRKEDIFEREIVRTSGIKIKAKSFAVPNIEPGVIIEYRYREVIEDGTAKGMRLAFQRDIPVQTLSYYYKPYNKNSPNFQSFNMTDTKFVKDDKGFYLAQKSDVPSFKEEPRMPPEDQVRPWMLLQGVSVNITNISDSGVSFRIKDPSNPQQYWGAISAERSDLTKLMTKSNGDIKKAAADVTAAASTPEEKLKRLYEFCQTQIKNTTFDQSLTDEDRQKLSVFKSIADVLKRKSGSVMEIDMLFGAMASSVGLETRIAHLSDRSEMFFDPRMTNEFFIRPGAIAVQVGSDWKFFNPGSNFLPYGIMPWSEEGVWALLVGEKSSDWVKTPITGYEKSAAKRRGKFKLAEDGTLEGDVRIEYAGQLGYRYKMENYNESAGKREEDLKQEIKRRISTAEISGISIENATEPEKSFVYAFKVRVPNYAQRTAKRLFLQPGFFEYGENPIFSGANRKYDVYFQYPWSEQDSIEIALPKGFALDSADAPALIADPQKIGSLNVNIAIDKASNTLIYKRDFHFGGGGNTLFPATAYQPLKNLFDAFNKADTHTITLKQN
jgi:hypothetical protein